MRTNVRTLTTLACAVLLGLSTTGCLGTLIETPTRAGTTQGTITPHILAAPHQIDASACEHGIKSVFIHVPLWGIAVGILTFGIVVPKATQYTCVAAP